MKNKIGVLLVNLGTPNSAHPRAVKRYLHEFLTDERVIDIPWFIRQIVVRGYIVPRRYRISASTYSKIWTQKGSPLLVFGQEVTTKLQAKLGEDFAVKLAMRYQNPSIDSVLKELKSLQLSHLLIFPLFPQYASATTGSVHQKVMSILQNWHTIPSLSLISSYAAEENFLKAFASLAAKYPLQDYDHVLFSFHGLPRRQITKADQTGLCLKDAKCCQKGANSACYRAQCFATASGIASLLAISHFTVSFQSRLGKEPWIEPYTEQTIISLARKGVKNILVLAPSFTADCLETVYEIGEEYNHLFRQHGGENLQLVESLNSTEEWIEALAAIIYKYCPQSLIASLL